MSDVADVNRAHSFSRPVFTFTVDFNIPGVLSGTRAATLRSPDAIQAFKENEIRIGDPVVAFFDSNEEEYKEWRTGWSMLGFITDVYLYTYPQTNAQTLKIAADYYKRLSDG
jgi:hypothetical protein